MRRLRLFARIAPLALLGCVSCAMLVGLEDKQPLADAQDGTGGGDALDPDGEAGQDGRSDAPVDPTTAEIVAADQNAPYGIAIDETYVYWTNSGSGTVWRRLKTLAGPPEQVATGQLGPKHMLVDESFVYWFNDNSPAFKDLDGATALEPLVMRIPRAAPAPSPEAVYSTAGSGAFIHASLRLQGVADPYLFANTATTVRRYTRAPIQITSVHTLNTVAAGDGIATDDGYVYWHNKGTGQTWRRSKSFVTTNAAPYPEKIGVPVGTASENVRDMASDDTSLYLASSNGVVYRMDKIVTGGAPYTDGGAGTYPVDAGDASAPTVVADSGIDLRRIVVSKDDRIYLVRWTSGADGEILALSKTSGAITLVARGQNDPVDLAVDTTTPDGFVYWTSSGDGTIRRAPAPK